MPRSLRFAGWSAISSSRVRVHGSQAALRPIVFECLDFDSVPRHLPRRREVFRCQTTPHRWESSPSFNGKMRRRRSARRHGGWWTWKAALERDSRLRASESSAVKAAEGCRTPKPGGGSDCRPSSSAPWSLAANRRSSAIPKLPVFILPLSRVPFDQSRTVFQRTALAVPPPHDPPGGFHPRKAHATNAIHLRERGFRRR